ncbi:MAG: hypothetical protein CMI52_05030 [Parcubacteria group bacterium]|nr:hypothetical protein [Parcubacteria group bacterium]
MLLELERFISIVHKGSVTKAAESHNISQPAISQSLKRLQEHLQLNLFTSLTPTPQLSKEGQIVYQLARRMNDNWEKIQNASELTNLRGSQIISLGLYDSAALKLIHFLKKNLDTNEYHFEMKIDNSRNLLSWLQAGLFDICICVVPQQYKPPHNITILKTYDEELIPVSGKKWNPKKEIPFILYDAGSTTRSYIDTTFQKNNYTPKILIESTNPNFLLEMAESGAGVTLLPQHQITDELKNKSLHKTKISFKISRTVGIFTTKTSHINLKHPLLKTINTTLK